MITCKINKFKQCLLLICLLLLTQNSSALNHLDEYFKFKSEGDVKSAVSILNKWKPKGFEESSYKNYFKALNENDVEKYWKLYQDLAKKRKLLKLQHDSIKRIIELDLTGTDPKTKKLKNFNKVAKKMLKNLQAQPEGLEYEFLYLKWILKNKNINELCKTERTRWLSQVSLTLSEVVLGLESCPVTYKDFIYRTRLLIFSGAEKKAQAEISEFAALRKLSDWEQAYLRAVYYSNIGDPTNAFWLIIPYQEKLKSTEEYYTNLFFIAQRAGELKKAEEIINEILKEKASSAQKKELIFQKAFLFYQTGRYSEAIELFTNLIQTHVSHKRKLKSREYDELTWLRSWCYFLNQDYEKAQETLMQNRKWAADKARNQYWLAQAEWALDNRMVAVALFRQLALPVIDGKYFSYYNFISWLRFESYKGYAASELLKTQIDSIRSGRGLYALPDPSTNPLNLLAEYESYFEDIGGSDEGNIQILNQEELTQDTSEIMGISTNTSKELKTELSWANDLIKWGYRDLAKWHLFEVEKTLVSRSRAEPLIKYYLNNKFYYRALSLTQNVNSPSGHRLSLKEDSLLWISLFPRAYEAEVLSESKKHKVEPNLAWSIMRAETQYKPDAISPVGAFGLMQFMPYTSQKVAKILNEEYNPENIFEPSVAIKYGATYLKKLSDELGGEIPLVAAAYNAGPHRVKLWLKNFKEKDKTNMNFDVFIEHIPFNETRTYVKRVLNNTLIYQKLYDDKLDFKKSKWLVEKIKFKLQEPISYKEEWPL